MVTMQEQRPVVTGGKQRYYLTSLVVLAATSVVGIAAYAPAVLATYGRLDDFQWMYDNAVGGESTHIGKWIDSGRFWPALLAWLISPAPTSVSQLPPLRGIATLMMCLGAGMIGVILLRISRRTAPAAIVLAVAIGAFALGLPAVPAIVTWAVLAGSSAAFPLAIAGGLFATVPRTRFLPWWGWSALLITIAAFSYQHVTPMALLPVLLYGAHRWVVGRQIPWGRIFTTGGIVGLSLAVNSVFLRLVDSDSLNRLGGHTWGERLQWLTGEFLPRSVDLGVPDSPVSLTVSAVALLVLLGSPLLLGRRYLMLSVAVVLAWLACAVTVVPAELWASYRLISAAQMTLWGGAGVCAAFTVLQLRRTVWRNVAIVLAVVAGSVSLLVGGQRAYRYFAVPSAHDWQAALCAVQDADPVLAWDRIEYNSYGASISPIVSYDEYGILTSSYDWSLAYMVLLAQQEEKPEIEMREDAADKVRAVPPDEAGNGFVSRDACSD